MITGMVKEKKVKIIGIIKNKGEALVFNYLQIESGFKKDFIIFENIYNNLITVI